MPGFGASSQELWEVVIISASSQNIPETGRGPQQETGPGERSWCLDWGAGCGEGEACIRDWLGNQRTDRKA